MKCKFENPIVNLRGLADSVNDHLVSFTIISSFIKLKTARLIEQKVFMKTKRFECRVVEYSDSILKVYSKKILKSHRNEIKQLKIDSNHNNRILFEAALKFFSSDKFIHSVIVSSYEKINRGAMNNNYGVFQEIGETYDRFQNMGYGICWCSKYLMNHLAYSQW